MKLCRRRTRTPPVPDSRPPLRSSQIEAIRRSLPLTPEETLYALALAQHTIDGLIRRLDPPLRRGRHGETQLGWKRMKQRLEIHRRRLQRQMGRMGEPAVQQPAGFPFPAPTWGGLFTLYERLIEGTKDIRLRAVLLEIWGETAIEHGWLTSWVAQNETIDPALLE
ncbi:MAG: hypothetical protein QJR06_05770 [Alicyclobacillaceae bacterium]|nr:hypothetical protein [Alicyclobacillaceae bacterium]